MLTRPIPTRRSGQARGCLVLFSLIFLGIGGVASYFVLWRPASKLLAARSWTETECTVLSSEVATVSSSDGDTYKVDIHYTWIAGGAAHESNRYDFMEASSSGTAGKQKIVDRYPPGARVPCWFNPDDPAEAVLSRGFSPVYLIGLLPLLFVAVGLVTLILTIRGGQGSSSPAAADPSSPFGVPIPATAGGPLELKPAVTPLGMLLGLGFVALFWNGIVSVFVVQAVGLWRSGNPSTFLNLFLIPFVAIGGVLVFAVARQLLVLFNPRPYLTLTPGAPATGENVFLQWRLGSGGRGVSRILITFEGREEAQYRRGTNTHTDRQTFFTLPVVDSAQSLEISAGGSAGFRVPEETMPSFRAEHNKVVWSLKVKCELPRWPDSEQEYEVVVRPPGSGA